MIVLLASDRSTRSDGGLMVQKYHSPGPPQGRQYPARADSGIGSRKISVLVWTIAKKPCLSSRLGCLFIEHCRLGRRAETPLMQVKAPPD
jgi:hypothetical protein